MNIDAFVELDDDFKTLEHDDFHDHTPIYCHLTWLPHLRVLWIRHRLSPTSQRHAENYHRDGRFVCGYYRNQQHKCILDRPQPPLWNRDKYSLSLVKWIGKFWKKKKIRTVEIWIGPLRSLRCRMWIKRVHSHQTLEFDGYSNQTQWHDSCSIQQCSVDAPNSLHLCRMYRIYQQMFHPIGKPAKLANSPNSYKVSAIFAWKNEKQRMSSHLHSMIFFITHINKAKCIGCYAPWIVKFAIGNALRAKRSQESSLWIQHLNAMIITIGNYVLSNAIDSHTS